MNTEEHSKPSSRRPFFVGLGQGVLSGVLAGLVVWYYVDYPYFHPGHEKLSTVAGSALLLIAVAFLMLFPVLNFVRRDWRVLVANITGLLFLIVFGMGYMVFVWVMLSHAQLP